MEVKKEKKSHAAMKSNKKKVEKADVKSVGAKAMLNDITKSKTSETAVKSGIVTAICNDGTDSYSATHSGSCADHGGVKEFKQ